MIGLLPGMRMYHDTMEPPSRLAINEGDTTHRWRETDTHAFEEIVHTVRIVPKPPDVAKHTSIIERELARFRDPDYTGVVDNGKRSNGTFSGTT